MAERKGERGTLRMKGLSDEHRENPFSPPAETADQKHYDSQEFVEKHLDKVFTMEIGGKSRDELIAEMKKAGIKISGHARPLLVSEEFKPLKNAEEIKLIRIKVKDLGFELYTRPNEIFSRAGDLGLGLCPSETGPQYLLAHPDLSKDDHVKVVVASVPMSGYDGNGFVFTVGNLLDDLFLDGAYATTPMSAFPPEQEIMFRIGTTQPEEHGKHKETKESALQRLKKLITG